MWELTRAEKSSTARVEASREARALVEKIRAFALRYGVDADEFSCGMDFTPLLDVERQCELVDEFTQNGVETANGRRLPVLQRDAELALDHKEGYVNSTRRNIRKGNARGWSLPK